MSEEISTEARDGVLHIEICRPEKKNALTTEMYEDLASALRSADEDPSIRVALLSGQPGIFSAGNDIEDFLVAADNPEPLLESARSFMYAFSELSKPVVAAVDGLAIGVGATMLLHCDLVYASRGARFQLPFVSLGVCPDFGTTLILPALLGQQRATEILFLNERLTADTAQQLGLVNEVLEDHAALMERAWQRAEQLAAAPPASVRLTKKLLKGATAEQVRQVIDDEVSHFMAMLRSPEAREAFTAFVEKRQPDFSRFS